MLLNWVAQRVEGMSGKSVCSEGRWPAWQDRKDRPNKRDLTDSSSSDVLIQRTCGGFAWLSGVYNGPAALAQSRCTLCSAPVGRLHDRHAARHRGATKS